MSLLRYWHRDLALLTGLVLLTGIASLFIGFFLPMLLIIFIAYSLRQIYLISRLERWLSRGAKGKVPTASGVWGNIYNHYYRIKKSEKKRNKTLGKIIDQFRKSTDVLPDAAIVLGKSFEIEWSNRLAKSVLGIKKGDKGQRIDNLIRFPEFTRFLKNKDNSKSLTMNSPVDSSMVLMFRMVSYGNGQQLVIAHDITQQINMETMRKNLVDNVSHELRTPLTVLKGYLETLQDMSDDQPDFMVQSLTQMGAQIDRMQYLVNDLLLLASLETRQKVNKPVDLVSLLEKICAESEAISKQKKRINLDFSNEINIMGEEQDLRSAFTNLLENALKYSDDDSAVKVVMFTKKERLILDFIDKGEGISALDIPRITERFYRVDVKRSRKLSGTGLGLAIVKHVLLRHEAQLQITSQVGIGSRFRCVFPHSCVIS